MAEWGDGVLPEAASYGVHRPLLVMGHACVLSTLLAGLSCPLAPPRSLAVELLSGWVPFSLPPPPSSFIHRLLSSLWYVH